MKLRNICDCCKLILPLRNVQPCVVLNVLRCFLRLTIFICSFVCVILTHLSASYMLPCIAFNWILVGVCAQTFSLCMLGHNNTIRWVCFTLTPTPKVGFTDGKFVAFASIEPAGKLKRAIRLRVAVCCAVRFFRCSTIVRQSLLCCRTENCVAARSLYRHTHRQSFPAFYVKYILKICYSCSRLFIPFFLSLAFLRRK